MAIAEVDDRTFVDHIGHHIPQNVSMFPDWEYPGYWLLKDNRNVSAAELADLLTGQPGVAERRLQALRGEVALER